MLKVIGKKLCIVNEESQLDSIKFHGQYYFSSCKLIEKWMKENNFTKISSNDEVMALKLMFPNSDELTIDDYFAKLLDDEIVKELDKEILEKIQSISRKFNNAKS